MGALIKIPSAGTPADRILARFNRDQLAGFIEMAISLLDATDGDPDVEANGDEMDGINSVDDPLASFQWQPHPGCPLANPDLAADGLPCDEELGVLPPSTSTHGWRPSRLTAALMPRHRTGGSGSTC